VPDVTAKAAQEFCVSLRRRMSSKLSSRGIVARILYSEEFTDGKRILLFGKLAQAGVFCVDALSNEKVNPITYYQTHPSEDFYFLSLKSHSILMGFVSVMQGLHFRVDLDYVQNYMNVELIDSLRQLVEELLAFFCFSFAHIDLEGDPPSAYLEDTAATDIRWLFWTNYFGENFLKKYGKQFLMQAPGWKTTDMGVAVKYLTRQSPSLSPTNDLEYKIQTYFSRFGETRLYSCEEFGFE
jgi:hypothetical protein